MSRTTIDFGIDLGTTNSAIALLKGVTTEIIKNNADTDITPSAVSIDKRGAIHVGQRAKNRIIGSPDDAYVEFKRRMGTDHTYHFKSCGQQRKPEELSAEILKSLKGDVQQRTGEVIEAAVITVPAAFESNQTHATNKAAELAGFKMNRLLQEPVAAALAYGFQLDQEKAYWLVYDFGGGTFDAAIIKAEEGTIHVVNHGGDNFLGGSDIDWAIVEHVLAPKLVQEFHLHEFVRGNPRWRQAFAILKRAAEIAKIEISRKEQETLETCQIKHEDGEQLEFECALTRSEIVNVAEPIILRSVEICKRVLDEKNLGRGGVEKIILVGGPTLAPYFREILASNLGIAIDHSTDPLTVVARGAAVYAGTLPLKWTPSRRDGQEQDLGYVIELEYDPVGMESAPIVSGKVSHPSNHDLSRYTLELVNTKTQWRSGKLALRPNGVFIVTLSDVKRGERNVFGIELLDPAGKRQKTTPDALTYTIGPKVGTVLINSMGVALTSNEYDRVFEKGQDLPAKQKRDYQTMVPIRRGQTGDVARIALIEGENERADRNRLVGTLEIKGEKIRRDLAAGTEVEVEIRIDESRIITVTAYVPQLDEEFKVTLDMTMHDTEPDVIAKDYQAEMTRLQELKRKVTGPEGQSVHEMLARVEESPLIQEISESLAAAKGDPDAAAKCEKRLLELKLKLDEASDALEWPELVMSARKELGYLNEVVEPHGDADQRQRAARLAEEIDGFIRERRPDFLRNRIKLVGDLWWEIVQVQPSFWINRFHSIEMQIDTLTDPVQGARLLNQGREAISKNNLVGLKNVVTLLSDLMAKKIPLRPPVGPYGTGVDRRS